MCDSVVNCLWLHVLHVVHLALALLPSSDSMADSILEWFVSGALCLRGVSSYCVNLVMCTLFVLQYRITDSRDVCMCVVSHTNPL